MKLRRLPNFSRILFQKAFHTLMALARKKILAHLKKTRAASAREIARALKMSAPNVRHHLSVLRLDGRVQLIRVNNREGRGRPEKVYALAQSSLGDNLPALANALLDVTGSKLKEEALAAQIMDANLFAGLPLQKRLALLIEKLNALNYQAHWEAGADGPRIILGHCPYAKALEGHAILCKMDLQIMRQALSRAVTQSAKHEANQPGACLFMFQVE